MSEEASGRSNKFINIVTKKRDANELLIWLKTKSEDIDSHSQCIAHCDISQRNFKFYLKARINTCKLLLAMNKNTIRERIRWVMYMY